MNIRTLFKDSAIYGIGNFVFKAISFLVFPLYTHALSVSDFGVMELIVTAVGVVALTTNLGLNNAVQRFYLDKDTEKHEQPVLVTTGLVCMNAWGSMMFVISAYVVYVFRDWLLQNYELNYIYILVALGTVLFQQNISYCLDLIRLYFRPLTFAMLSAGSSMMNVLLCLLFLLYMYWGVLGYFLAAGISCMIMFPIALFAIRRDIVLQFDIKWAKTLVRFGYPFIFAGLAYWALSSVDRWMLATYTSNTETGLYSVGAKFASIVVFLNTAISQAWSPFMIKLYVEDKKYKEKIAYIYSIYLVCISCVGIVLCLFAKDILVMLTPEAYWPAATTLSILSMGAVIYGTTQFSVIGISLEKRTTWLSYVSAGVLVINILFNFMLIPSYGADGAALAMAISYLCMTVFYFVCTNKLHYIPYNYAINIVCLMLLLGASSITVLNDIYGYDYITFFTRSIIAFVVFGVMVIVLYMHKRNVVIE